MLSGHILHVLTWRNAGWASTTVTLSPLVSTLPPRMSAIVREDTLVTALCTATRRKDFVRDRKLCRLNDDLVCNSNDVTFFPHLPVVIMNVVRVSAAAARGLNANVPWGGHPTPPLWF